MADAPAPCLEAVKNFELHIYQKRDGWWTGRCDFTNNGGEERVRCGEYTNPIKAAAALLTMTWFTLLKERRARNEDG